MKILRCEQVSKKFDGVIALSDVTLEFPTTGIVALIGPNGAGKTTLLNVLTGFIRPDSGHYYLDDRNISGYYPYRVALLGIARTFQDLRLIRHISSIENVLLGIPKQSGERLFRALIHLGIKREELRNQTIAMSILRHVGLEEMAYVLANELSYGQQKLLTLASCLATEARILLLDEPVSGVHPAMAAQILEILVRFRDEGRLVIFIEHDIAAVRKVADKVIVMDEGKVIINGSPHEVFSRPEIMEAYLA